MIAAMPICANPRSICTYPASANSHFLSSLPCTVAEPPRICTFHSYFNSFVFSRRPSHSEQILYHVQLQKWGGHSASSTVCVDSLLSTAFLSPPSPWPARHGGCEAPGFALHSNLSNRKFYLIDLQGLRNSVSRNSCIPKRLRIPGGWGGQSFLSVIRSLPVPVRSRRLRSACWPPASGHRYRETLAPFLSSKGVCSRKDWTYNHQLVVDPRRVCP